jgi:hypothetical protein
MGPKPKKRFTASKKAKTGPIPLHNTTNPNPNYYRDWEYDHYDPYSSFLDYDEIEYLDPKSTDKKIVVRTPRKRPGPEYPKGLVEIDLYDEERALKRERYLLELQKQINQQKRREKALGPKGQKNFNITANINGRALEINNVNPNQ